jgi:hypothetical protein
MLTQQELTFVKCLALLILRESVYEVGSSFCISSFKNAIKINFDSTTLNQLNKRLNIRISLLINIKLMKCHYKWIMCPFPASSNYIDLCYLLDILIIMQNFCVFSSNKGPYSLLCEVIINRKCVLKFLCIAFSLKESDVVWPGHLNVM